MELSIFGVSYRFLMKVATHVQSTEKGSLVKNGRGLLDHGTLKSAVSQESELIRSTDFFAC